MGNLTQGNPTELCLQGYIEEDEYCRQRGISRRTAQRERHQRQGPPYLRLGQRIYYRVDAVRTWLTAQEVEPARTRLTRQGRPPAQGRGTRRAAR